MIVHRGGGSNSSRADREGVSHADAVEVGVQLEGKDHGRAGSQVEDGGRASVVVDKTGTAGGSADGCIARHRLFPKGGVDADVGGQRCGGHGEVFKRLEVAVAQPSADAARFKN